MSPVLPFDIAALIIDIVGENNDTNLLKELSLVSHSFHQMCSKHLFATVDLHAVSKRHVTSPKRRFIKLLQSRPDVVKHIRKLMYVIEFHQSADDRLLSILPNLLRTISHLNYLKIFASLTDWNTVDSSMKSALLHLMHLPTINHIELWYIHGFPLSNLTPSVNLLRLDMTSVFGPLEEGGSPEFVVQSEMMPKLREFRTSDSTLLTTKLLNAKMQDGRPAFNFKDLRRLSLSSDEFEGEWNHRFLLQNAKLLEKLRFSFGHGGRLVGLHDLLSPSARTLKVLDLIAVRLSDGVLSELWAELEAMTGHYMLEALSFGVYIDVHDTENCIRSMIEEVEKILVKPGWSALRHVSFEFSFRYRQKSREEVAKLSEALLQYLPDKCPNFSKLEFVAIHSSYVIKSELEF